MENLVIIWKIGRDKFLVNLANFKNKKNNLFK